MDTSTIVNIVLCILSFILAAISVVTVVVTIRQNHKMIEESNRPIVSVYTQGIMYSGKPSLYLVVKNFGNSTAHMTQFVTDINFINLYGFNAPRNYIDDLSKCVIAPGQSHICRLDYKKITKPIHFFITYHSSSNPQKNYQEEFDVDLTAAVFMPKEAPANNSNASAHIASALENILFTNL